ncbi:MAG: nucleotidyltransferase domain-containing protein [Melioribacteraceae bacterium]
MASTIVTYLQSLSSKYYLKNDSNEIVKIDNSLSNLLNNIDKELGYLIKRRFVFGSYDRDTILPRDYDKYSDIDLMVVFNTTDFERTPETYRTWLKNFADKYYKDRYGSEVVKEYPTVTIRLNHIKYDLVPAKEEKGFFSTSLYIPNKDSIWQQTDPYSIKENLIEANTKYNSIVRPIIRLMKAWNAKSNYPYNSYELELFITEQNFYGDNIQEGFFHAIKQLSPNWNDSQTKKDKIEILKNKIEQVIICINNNDIIKAKQHLHHVLPY